MTPYVAHYIGSRQDQNLVLPLFDKLLNRKTYLTAWQTWWVQSAIASRKHFAMTGNSHRRLRWVRESFDKLDHASIPRAQAALALARSGDVRQDELLRFYDRSTNVVRPQIVAAIGALSAESRVREAVAGDSELNRLILGLGLGDEGQ
jgi:HEAT repeat protein